MQVATPSEVLIDHIQEDKAAAFIAGGILMAPVAALVAMLYAAIAAPHVHVQWIVTPFSAGIVFSLTLLGLGRRLQRRLNRSR